MKQCTLYDEATGFITGHYSASRPPHDAAYVEGHFDERDYLIAEGEAVAAPTWEPVVSANRVEGIPAGSRVEWAGPVTGEAVVDDGVLEFDLVEGQGMLVTVWAPGTPPYYLEVGP